ncbi:M48 family metallopeptidase [Salinibacter ruber]|uniref:YgjP-like metallopeptidase domain-containing protein n=1 Tax=Salinibacter ruber TaxID=146919 RepID=A0A9X2TEZ0_9BACT|nr:SprT family zinc-dependent metalloprotease [Salinibacter ruber]MCS3659904.1 hypothetical protein [Salinibacter ruber]MCS3709945.1 hypothetical protein [Salinibacter ruber]MCS4170229.1 hypothetical protein [Salinibacter ruber]
MSTTRAADLQGEAVTYEVRRSEKASQTRIDAGLDGITVVIPARLEVDPDGVLEEKADWVLRQQDRYARYRDEMPERWFEEGECFPVLWKERPVEVTSIPESRITQEVLELSASRVESTSIREELEHLYQEAAREHFTTRADHFCEAMGTHYEQIQIRNQKTRWGSYSPRTGTLSLDFRLLMAPSGVIDYVIVHELAHQEHSNHGPRFWRLVEQHVPDYEAKNE